MSETATQTQIALPDKVVTQPAGDRESRQGFPWDDVVPYGARVVETAPERVIWGTDWPHPRLEKDMPEDGHLLDLFNAWTPEPLRKKILVDNPQKLYGFA